MDTLTHLLEVALIGGLALNAAAGLIRALFRRDPLTWICVLIVLLWSGHTLLALTGLSLLFDPLGGVGWIAGQLGVGALELALAGLGAYLTRASQRTFEAAFLHLLSPGRW